MIKTVARILPSGYVTVERNHNIDITADHTVITGNDFSVLCGKCGSLLLKRERRDNEGIGFRQSWLYRGSFMQETGTIGV